MPATHAPSPTHLRSLYRSLLRELPPRPILAPARSPVHTRLRASFSKADSPAAVAVAEQLVTYLRSQRTYATLLERYNPGMDMDQEERVRLSARRVGMNMPQPYVKEDHE